MVRRKTGQYKLHEICFWRRCDAAGLAASSGELSISRLRPGEAAALVWSQGLTLRRYRGE